MARVFDTDGWTLISENIGIQPGDMVGFRGRDNVDKFGIVFKIEPASYDSETLLVWANNWSMYFNIQSPGYLKLNKDYPIYYKPKVKPYDPEQEPWDEDDI